MTTEFEKKLFNTLTQQNAQKNLIYSPYLIRMCLAMIYVGIDGPARQELAKALNYKKTTTNQEIMMQFSPLFRTIDYPIATEDEWDYTPEPLDLPKWYIKSSIYVKSGVKILSSYKEFVMKAFGANVSNANYSPRELETENGLFRTAMSRPKLTFPKPDSFNPKKSSIVVACAAYYNATWLNTFNIGATKQRFFLTAKKKRSTINIMTLDEQFEYAELPELSSKAINMPFHNSNLSMLFILPQRKIEVAKLLKLMSNFDVRRIAKRLTLRTVKLSMPKFKLNVDLSLLPVLQKLGVQQIFKGGAQYTKLTNSKTSLHVTDITQKIFIYVTERGLEMSYYTSIGHGFMSTSNLKIESGDLTRPFVFVLWDQEHTYIVGHANDLILTY